MTPDLTGKKTKNMSKHEKTIAIITVILAGLAIGAYFVWNSTGKEAPAPTVMQVPGHNIVENSAGQKRHSAMPSAPTNADDSFIVNLEGKTVSQYVKSLYDAANKGDANAAYNIYAAETICASLPKTQNEIAKALANTTDEALQQMAKKSQAVCSDFNISPRERLAYLRDAAKGGNVNAMMSYGVEPPEGIDPTKPLDMNDPRVVQWLKDSVDYMTEAATKGNAMAMMGVATYYEQGDIVPKNIPLALTYEIAAQMQRNPNATSYDNYPTINRLESQLTSDQIASAKADARTLVMSASSK